MKTTLKFKGSAAIEEAARIEKNLKEKNIVVVKKIYNDTCAEISYEEPKPPIFT